MWIFGLYACMAFATLVIGHILSISEKPKEDLDTIIVIFSLISLMLNNIINYFPKLKRIIAKNTTEIIKWLLIGALSLSVLAIGVMYFSKLTSFGDFLKITGTSTLLFGVLYWTAKKKEKADEANPSLIFAAWWGYILIIYISKLENGTMFRYLFP